jgi:predicted nucleic-acid-binding Zn-ribbon protein
MDENTFDCPKCGAKIYPEMTRCPQCGQEMYPEDEETGTSESGTDTLNWGSTLGALLIGLLIASGIALILHFIVASFVSPSMLGGFGKTVLFLSGPLGSLVGGFVCASIAKVHPKLVGGIVGVLSLPVMVLLATHWIQITPTLLFSLWSLGIGVLIVLSGVCGGWLNLRFSQNDGWQEQWKVRGWEDLLYQDLLRKVSFNGPIADRLIEYERKQQPEASRLKLIQNAIERWERDNR